MRTLREFALVNLHCTGVSSVVLSYHEFMKSYANEVTHQITTVNAVLNSFPVELGSIYPVFIQIRMHALPEVKEIGECINEIRKSVCQLLFLLARTHERNSELVIPPKCVTLSTCIAFCAMLDKQNTLFFLKDENGNRGLAWITDEELAELKEEWKKVSHLYGSPRPCIELQYGTIDRHYAMLLKHGCYVCKEAYFNSCDAE
jgi:hypothetical protein